MSLSALDAEIRDLMRFAAQRSMLPRFRALADHEVEMKGEDDPVTIVDREVEAFLTEALTKLAPGVAVVGEVGMHPHPARLADGRAGSTGDSLIGITTLGAGCAFCCWPRICS